MGGDAADGGLRAGLLGLLEVGVATGVMAPVARPRKRALGLLAVAAGRLLSAEALAHGVWGRGLVATAGAESGRVGVPGAAVDAEELGLDPGPELAVLQARVRADYPALDAGAEVRAGVVVTDGVPRRKLGRR
jgi:hypothetical protein